MVLVAYALIRSADGLMKHFLELVFYADYVVAPAPNLPFERVSRVRVSLFLSIAKVGAQV